jgi:hypothetical protein
MGREAAVVCLRGSGDAVSATVLAPAGKRLSMHVVRLLSSDNTPLRRCHQM